MRPENSKVAQNDLRGIVAGQAGHVAAGMAARSAQIELRNVRAVGARPAERAMVSDLVVGESPDQQITLAHVRQAALDVERRAGERVDDGILEVGRVPPPQLQHLGAMCVARAVPVRRLSVQPSPT